MQIGREYLSRNKKIKKKKSNFCRKQLSMCNKPSVSTRAKFIDTQIIYVCVMFKTFM